MRQAARFGVGVIPSSVSVRATTRRWASPPSLPRSSHSRSYNPLQLCVEAKNCRAVQLITVSPPTGTLEVTVVSSQYWDLTNTSATTGSSSSAAWFGPTAKPTAVMTQRRGRSYLTRRSLWWSLQRQPPHGSDMFGWCSPLSRRTAAPQFERIRGNVGQPDRSISPVRNSSSRDRRDCRRLWRQLRSCIHPSWSSHTTWCLGSDRPLNCC